MTYIQDLSRPPPGYGPAAQPVYTHQPPPTASYAAGGPQKIMDDQAYNDKVFLTTYIESVAWNLLISLQSLKYLNE